MPSSPTDPPPLPDDHYGESEISALEKYSCPACGAAAQWTPAKHALVCAYCGTESEAELSEDGSGIVEHPLAEAIRAKQEEKGGWESDRASVQCKSCKAITLFRPGKVAQRCDFCGSPAVVRYTETKHPIHPESLLPFKVSAPQVREQMRDWYRSRWFAPNRFKRAAFTDTLHGVYLPYWTFDKEVHADWTAQAGHYYYVNKTKRDSKGNTRNVRERRTRWVPASGAIEHFFDDELVPATRGIPPKLLRSIEPFPTDKLFPYDTGYVSGWTVEQYQIDLLAAARAAAESIEGQVHSMCARDVPGDTHRFLKVSPHYSNETFKHILVPVWLLSYTYGRRSFQVAVNGQSGKIAGTRPYSWIKITLAVLAAIILILIIAGASGILQ